MNEITLDKRAEVEFELRKLYHKYDEIVADNRWPIEKLRWHELLLSLLLSINKNSQHKIRNTIDRLSDLELLNIEDLTVIKNGDVDWDSRHAKQIADILREFEFTDEEIRNSISVIYQTAKSVKDRYQGKIQKYFRKYGQLMVNEIQHDFSIRGISEDQIKYAVTFWLQNVLNMPISLKDAHTEEFCINNGIMGEHLEEVSDKLDINFVVTDDLIRAWYMSKKDFSKTVCQMCNTSFSTEEDIVEHVKLRHSEKVPVSS